MIQVMIVTGSAEVREGLRTILELSGEINVCQTAANLEEAVSQASARPPDVILIDLEMPVSQGWKILTALRCYLPDVPLIALTAHDYPAVRARAYQFGARSVIVKGLDLQPMIDLIRSAIAQTDR